MKKGGQVAPCDICFSKKLFNIEGLKQHRIAKHYHLFGDKSIIRSKSRI
jgi:hypothetical protein